MASPIPLTLLAATRLGFGSAAFFVPGFTASTFYYPVPATSNLLVRTLGIRDLALGALLISAKTPEVRRAAVLASVAVDVLDVVACVWSWEKGELQGVTAGVFSGCAVASLALAGVGWKVGMLGAVGAGVAL